MTVLRTVDADDHGWSSRSTVRDTDGVRVVSLVPSATETLLALGADVVACTRFCEQPDLPHVGGTKNPDVAAIVALAPDLVVVDEEENRREDAEALVAAGVELLVTSVRSVDDALRATADWPRRPAGPCRRASTGPRRPPRPSHRHGVRADLAAAVDDDQRRHVRRLGARRPRHRAGDGDRRRALPDGRARRRRRARSRRSSSSPASRTSSPTATSPSSPPRSRGRRAPGRRSGPVLVGHPHAGRARAAGVGAGARRRGGSRRWR